MTNSGITLAHEPELEELWTELQDKVSVKTVSVLLYGSNVVVVCFAVYTQCLQVEGLKSEYEKKLSQQRQQLEVSECQCSLVPRPLPRLLKTWEWPGDEAMSVGAFAFRAVCTYIQYIPSLHAFPLQVEGPRNTRK